MITTVIFDMDDTLYDEIDYCSSGFRAVGNFLAEKCNSDSKAVFDALWGEFIGGNHKTTFNSALDKIGATYTKDDIIELVKVYREHKPDIKLPQDSKMALETMEGKYRLALLTDGFLPAQRYKVESLDIEKYFECIIFTEELGREFWKPNPRGFEIILEKFATKGENAVYIADNAKKDFIAPNYLDMKTIQLIRPNKVHKSPPPDEASKPQYIADSMSDVIDLVEKL